MAKNKQFPDEVFYYQDELLHEIDYLCFTLSDCPNSVNRCLVRLINELNSLKDEQWRVLNRLSH